MNKVVLLTLGIFFISTVFLGFAYHTGSSGALINTASPGAVYSDAQLTTVSVGSTPFGIAYDSGNSSLYVTNFVSNDVSVISPSNTVVATVGVGTGPDGIAYDSSNGNVYVANAGTNNVSVISPSNSVVATVAVGSEPEGVAYDSGTGNVYVPNYGSNDVSIIETGYLLEFTETGLPSGTAWNVTVDSENYTSTTNTIALAMAEGEISYTVTSSSATYAATGSLGTVFISGEFTQVKVSFSPVNYTIEFAKSGLPSGTPWSVTLNGVQKSSTSNIAFTITNGTYAYDISPVSGYTISSGAYSGTVAVSGSNQIISNVWSQSKAGITFIQKGLPSGTMWSVSIGGSTHISTSPSLTISLQNGTYSYTVRSSNTEYSSSTGTSKLTVDGKSITETVTFSEVNYTLTIHQKGLSKGTMWNLSIDGVKYTSTAAYLNVSVSNGTKFISASSGGYSSSAVYNSTSVSGANGTFNVSFSRENSPATSSLVYLGSAGIIGAAAVISSMIFLRLRRH